MRKINLALAQIQISKKFDDNVNKAFEYVEKTKKQKFHILCFPEQQFLPFFPQYQKKKEYFKYAISSKSEIIKKFQEKSKEHNLVIVPNFYEKDQEKYYDSSPVIDTSGKLLGTSRMVHIVQAEQFYEQDYYTPSNTGFKIYPTKYGKIGLVICFDRHFPESIRLMALMGAELVIIPTANTTGEPLDFFEWELKIAAYHNQVYIAMVNRVGKEGKMDFCGESIIIDPYGKVIKKANNQEQLLTATIDLDLIKKARTARPFLKLRRPETYNLITQ